MDPVFNDPQKAFEHAIKQGLRHPERYMYMGTVDGQDQFKHIDTREYVRIKAAA